MHILPEEFKEGKYRECEGKGRTGRDLALFCRRINCPYKGVRRKKGGALKRHCIAFAL